MNTILTPSPLSEVNAELQSSNPFAQPPFVNANNVWGKGFPDVESLNVHASDAVFKALEDIRLGQYSTTSILITAQDGTGKTHIISRIRHHLQNQGGALFIFANKFNNLNRAKLGFQQILADSLSNIGSQGVKQWQELATAMTNEVLQNANSEAQPIAPKNLVKKLEGSDENQVGKWISQLTKKFCKLKNVQDPDIVRAVFWTLSENEVAYASNWLAGKELAQFKANELKLPTQKQSFDAVLQILNLISDYNEVVICFDELDVLEFDDSGLHKSQIVANLVKELFENLRRGIILSVMMPGTWKDRVQKELPGGVWNKITAQGQPCELKYLDSETTVELVAFFLKEYYEARELVPPHPIYPFDEGQLKAIGREKPTVREVLKWCREHCKPVELEDVSASNQDITPTSNQKEIDPVEIAYLAEINENFEKQLDENYLIADALFLGLQGLVGQTIENVRIEEVTTVVGKKKKRDEYLNFKVIGEEKGKKVCIGVAVLQYEGGAALGAGFRRLLDEEKRYGLTRGCLVRSKEKLINSYFQKTYLHPLVKQGGEFVELKIEDVRPLLAIQSVYRKRESDYELEQPEIFKFVLKRGEEFLLGAYNPLLKEIMSDPSYQVPDDIKDEPEYSSMTVLGDDLSENLDAAESDELAELMVNG